MRRKMRRMRGLSRGMTLTEVLMAMAILAFALTPVLKALTQAHRGGTRLDQKSTSWLLAQSQIEELRARGATDWASSWSAADKPLKDGYRCTITDSGPTGDRRTVRIRAGYDADMDGRLDSSEISADMSFLIARSD